MGASVLSSMDAPPTKVPGSHDHGIGVARHFGGLRYDKAVNGRSGLDAAAQGDQTLGRSHFDGLDDIGARRVIGGGGLHAQLFKDARGQDGGFERLRHGVRSHEQPLIEGLIADAA